MRLQPNRNYVSDDVVQTPLEMAGRLVKHFKPKGRILEPCCGAGHFLHFLPNADWCEISQGRDFMEWNEPVDWIITNPPWSKIRPFLQQAMTHADNIVFLFTINHLWTKARMRDIKEMGFGVREICLLEMPDAFPQSGFQLGAVHLKRGWNGDMRLSDLSRPLPAKKPIIRRGSLRSVVRV